MLALKSNLSKALIVTTLHCKFYPLLRVEHINAPTPVVFQRWPALPYFVIKYG